MANHKDKKVGECLVRIALQAEELSTYILNPAKNGGRIGLGVIKQMSNVIVSNVQKLEELDKETKVKA